jgi:hypothetical protein
MTFDLTPFAGQTVRLRSAEVDDQSFFEASVDAVTITRTTSQSIPTMGPTGHAVVILALLVIGTIRLARSRPRPE